MVRNFNTGGPGELAATAVFFWYFSAEGSWYFSGTNPAASGLVLHG